MKITDKLQLPEYRDRVTWSYEYFPPKTSTGVVNLYNRIERMRDWGHPTFVDVTWGAGGSSSDLTPVIVKVTQSDYGLDTCMHLTCTNMATKQIDEALERAYKVGCRNILALRGDPVKHESEWTALEGGFEYACDLVRHIRKKYGDEFCIGVAGYPEGYAPGDDIDATIKHLKIKVDEGASFIVTQMFYDAENFVDWVKRVRAAGITIPIFPGIMPIQSWSTFNRRCEWSGVRIPQHFIDALEPLKDDDALVREKGSELMAEMCQKLVDNGITRLHFYTMNLEKATKMIIEKMGLLNQYIETPKNELTSHIRSPSQLQFLDNPRPNETVRPMFWKTRSQSFISRTEQWDEFPNGRWGDSRSPAFGEFDPKHHGLKQTDAEIRALWGSPENIRDLGNVFAAYCERKLACLPWSDIPLSGESAIIADKLAELNRQGILTINSQPPVCAAPSTDPLFGWGPAHGYVFQKAYLEFFMHPDQVKSLLEVIPSFKTVQYYITDYEGSLETNGELDVPSAVTWGVFPNSEVIQPTVVESASFLAWKDEAYSLGLSWAKAHSSTSAPFKLLTNIVKEWKLCVIVDNDFRAKDTLFRFLEQVKPLRELHPEFFSH
ncbi:methylenetetrahydrofolate reductase Met9 [Schizosaccharomyces japonicus yFS275]|uniref:Methylenetetrahydrofolate reductase Met9 n=1 Tax=Schizosaccharomyces japonicus (strain yFS275 / FY16936) TaxID=402676 RepID=B6K4Z7_SCHJY|nr:methylenetetrahydrofolate reductase Met9 [Schizosaccharomyces japonicus yFS275]EEB08554.1 methylenetetrahydrofolate reductase Met9 [Schizosaccharomyces japonicus yFS275]